MKAIITLFAVLSIASIGFAADAAKGEKKPVDMEAMFKKKDANGDGKISKEEYTKGAKDAAKSEAQFATKDKDKDGNLTKEEFMAKGGKKK